MNMLKRAELTNFLDQLLNINIYQDYGPNGLQIKGTNEIKKIAFAVSATKESVQKAVELEADALVVHHGLFWKFHGTRPIIGPFYDRVAPLIKNDINLLGYHLPLDGHKEVGNAAMIAKKLEMKNLQAFGDHKGAPTGIKAEFTSPMTPLELSDKLAKILNHTILHSSPGNKQILSLGIITGGANSEWKLCLDEGLDSYLTGEMSEHDWHEAKESGIHFFAGGHNATEQYGVQALLETLKEKFSDKNLELIFIESKNPA